MKKELIQGIERFRNQFPCIQDTDAGVIYGKKSALYKMIEEIIKDQQLFIIQQIKDWCEKNSKETTVV